MAVEPGTQYSNILCTAHRDTLLKIDLSDLHPELKGKRIRGMLDGTEGYPFFLTATD